MTGIVDYNAGNIRSVERALDALGAAYVTSKTPEGLERADRILFPGVGEARYAMEQLRKSGFDLFLKDWAASGKPLLGICLGSQIIFDYSEEGDTVCLGLIPGKIRHFSSLFAEMGGEQTEPDTGYKIPHMGWNTLEQTDSGKSKDCSEIFKGVTFPSDVYFVHSYVIQPENCAIIAARANYRIPVPAVIRHKNICAFQFHPEKSGETGLRLLGNFTGSGTIRTEAVQSDCAGGVGC